VLNPRVARLALVPAIVLSIGPLGCSSSPTAPSLAHGSMSATVDDVPWTATTNLTATFDGMVLSISGSDATTTLALSIRNSTGAPLGTGIVSINTSSVSNATLTIKPATGSAAPVTLMAGAIAGSGGGPVSITALSPVSAVGSFTLVFATSGINGAKAVTDGKYSVKF